MSADPLHLAPAQRLRRWHFWLLVWRVHRWLGLGFGLLLVLLSATGSLLVIHHELEARFESGLHRSTLRTFAPPPPLRTIAQQVAAVAPAGYRPFRLLPAGTADETHQFIFLAPDNRTRWSAFVAPASGEILWHGPDQSLLTPWLLGLHMNLHAGRAGYVVTGVAGVGLALLGLTGLYLYRDRLAGLARHPFRLHLGWRVALSDLHKWIGVVAIYFPLVLGVTGTLYVVSILQAKPAAAVPATLDPAQLAPLEPVLDAARRQFPGAEILRLQFPAQAEGALVALVLHREAPPWRKFSRIDFDARTGAVRAVRDGARAPAAEQFAAMLAPLHFGFYGAAWMKWAYFVGGLAPGALALTGAGLWWVRRRQPAGAGVS